MPAIPRTLQARLPIFYGYVIAGVAVLTMVCSSPGQTFAISAFTPVLQAELGLSPSQLAGAYMLGTFFAAFPLSVVGPLADRYGLRVVTVAVACGLGLACVVVGAANSFASLAFGFFLVRFLGQGAITLLSSNMVSMWFRDQLGRVNAVMSVGSAIAFAWVPVLMIESIEHFGWRLSYACMGGVVVASLVPVLILIFVNRPEDLGLLPDGRREIPPSFPPVGGESGITDAAVNGTHRLGVGESSKSADERTLEFREAIQHRSFWILATSLGLWAMAGTGVIFYSLPVFEELGLEKSEIKQLFGYFSVSMLSLQVLGGFAADRWSPAPLLAVAFCLLTVGIAWIPFTDSVWDLRGFGALFGAGQGLALAVSSTMWVRYYGRRHLGKIRGAVWCTTVAGSGCGPFLLGLSKDFYGGYTPGIWLFASLLALVTPLILLATPPGQRAGVSNGKPH
ncbi:MAG: MFS transporter [Pirellulaceae bacterium]